MTDCQPCAGLYIDFRHNPEAGKVIGSNVCRHGGGFELSFSREEGKLESIIVKSMKGNTCQIKYGEKIIDPKTDKGKPKRFLCSEDYKN